MALLLARTRRAALAALGITVLFTMVGCGADNEHDTLDVRAEGSSTEVGVSPQPPVSAAPVTFDVERPSPALIESGPLVSLHVLPPAPAPPVPAAVPSAPDAPTTP